MADLADDLVLNQTEALLNSYGFEMKGETAQEVMTRWLQKYPVFWLRLAVIEALYLGRYKAVSVEQILNLWLRRGHTIFHFSHDFESLICNKLPNYPMQQLPTQKSQERKIANPPATPQPQEFTKEEKGDGNCQGSQRTDEMSKKKTTEPANRGYLGNTNQSIPQFTPDIESSEFYYKLKTIINDNS